MLSPKDPINFYIFLSPNAKFHSPNEKNRALTKWPLIFRPIRPHIFGFFSHRMPKIMLSPNDPSFFEPVLSPNAPACRSAGLTPVSISNMTAPPGISTASVSHSAFNSTYKALDNESPQYLSDLLHIRSHRYNICASLGTTLHIPRTNKSAGDRSFAAIAPRLWNSLPDHISAAITTGQFKRLLKYHLFN